MKHPRRCLIRALACAALGMLLAGSTLHAQPTGPQAWWPVQPQERGLLHTLFTNDMVLQRDLAAPIWGWTQPGTEVQVYFDDQPAGKPVRAESSGRWSTKLGPYPAGGPHSIRVVAGKQQQAISNVLCGDVWLCSGQSNMNWPVRLSDNAETEVQNANYPQIRSFTVGFYPALVPQQLPQPARWEVCTPEFAKNFTGVGYFFAREIHQQLKVPIGIIHASVGATAAEAWVSGDALRRQMPYDFPERLQELDQTAAIGGPDYDLFAALQRWTAEVDPRSKTEQYTSRVDLDTSDWREIEVPRPWEEAGLPDYDGLVWFRHTIELPEKWNGQDLQLGLSIIKDFDIVWFNGHLIGSKQLAGIRNYRIAADQARPGKNLLVVAVLNKEGPGGFCSAPQNMSLRPVGSTGAELLKIAGTWKAKPAVKLSDLKAPFPEPQVGHYKTITSLYNGMIAPLIPYGIKGVLWYQGEANGPFWLQYRRLLPTLIADWRGRFEVGDFPFLIVSLANLNAEQTQPVEPGWAEIRESQWRTTRLVPNTGLAMTIDIGNPKDIHPRNKQEVGRRLALVARRRVYGEHDLIDSGPEFTEMQIELPKGDRIRLYFKNLGGGLMIRPGDDKLTGFVVAGPDKNFVWADAKIEGDTIVVSSPEVATPKYVRYGWAWNPKVNLFNQAGLPAITFRTDE